jgi:hypothetical protein
MSSTSLCGRNLKPATLEALNLSDAQRKLKVWDLKNTWLPYPRADGLIAYAEELLLTDELNTAIAGSLLKQRRFLVALKHLANKLKLSIIATGTQDAKIALAPDSQLTSRFAMEELYRWVDDKEFRKLLESFERRLPLREASELQRPSFAKMIHDLTEGYLGEVAELLMKAAVLAIDTHKEKIDLDIIQKLKWLPPSKRQGAARDK